MIRVNQLKVGHHYTYDHDPQITAHITHVERIDGVNWLIEWQWSNLTRLSKQILLGDRRLDWTLIYDEDEVPL